MGFGFVDIFITRYLEEQKSFQIKSARGRELGGWGEIDMMMWTVDKPTNHWDTTLGLVALIYEGAMKKSGQTVGVKAQIK